jgi:hypothetical protein
VRYLDRRQPSERFHLSINQLYRLDGLLHINLRNMPAIPNEAGPSRVKPEPPVTTEPKDDVDDPRANIAQTASTTGPAQAEEGDEDEERMDFKAIESIARYVFGNDCWYYRD